MTTRQQAQITLFDYTDDYLVDINPSAITLTGGTNGLTQSNAVDVYFNIKRSTTDMSIASKDSKSGDGTTKTFTVSTAGAKILGATVGGLLQSPNTYTISNNSITFNNAPASGTNNIILDYTTESSTDNFLGAFNVSITVPSGSGISGNYIAGNDYATITFPAGLEESDVISIEISFYDTDTQKAILTYPKQITYSVSSKGSQGDPGTDGADGTDGYNYANLLLYQRAATAPSAPGNTLYYKFSDGKFYSNSECTTEASLGNWSLTIPADNGYACYVIGANVYSQSAAATIASGSWSSARVLVEDPYELTITSSGGIYFYNTVVDTTLTVTVTRGSTTLTSEQLTALGLTLKWYYSDGTTTYPRGSTQHTGATLEIGPDDVVNALDLLVKLETTS